MTSAHSIPVRNVLALSARSAWFRWFCQACGKVAAAVHRTSQDHVVSNHFIEQDVLVKRTQEDEEAPRREPRMGEPTARPEERVFRQQEAGGFHGVQITVGNLPSPH